MVNVVVVVVDLEDSMKEDAGSSGPLCQEEDDGGR